ncbi:MAG TPA: glycosyltransferase family A protein [Stellaceae bacterium]|nr:glycosyltransferase family A protein [Stellaceae bacterium]
MPHRGCEAYLAQSVASILNQADVSLRLYLVDDASPTGDWLQIIAPWRGDPRLVALQTSRQAGPFRITNWVLAHSQEPFIAFQDADDWSAPDRLRRQVAALRQAQAGIIGTAYHIVAADGTPLRTKTMPRNVNLAHWRGRDFSLLHSTAVMRRSVLTRLTGFDGSDQALGADAEFYLRATFACRLRNLPQPLYFYRQRPDSLTTARATGYGSSIREAYEATMRRDFRRRRRQRLMGMIWPPVRERLSLAPRPNDIDFAVREPLGADLVSAG